MNTNNEDYYDLKQFNNCYTIESSRIDEYIKAINDLNIRSVYICDLYYDLCNIAFLQECPNVEEININSKYIQDVKGLLKLKKLKTLIIQDIDCTIDLSVLPSIEDLSFTWNKNYANFTALENVRCLRIWNYNAKSKDLEELMFAKKLEELDIVRTTLITLNMIEELKGLKSFGLSYASKLESVEPLIHNNTLRKVYFDCCKSITDFEKLANMKQLEKISICNCGEIESIKFIEELSNLKWFVCMKTNIIDGDLTPSKYLEYSAFDNKKHYHRL